MIISIINPFGINKVINMQYGDNLLGTRYLVMSAEPYRSDYKTPYIFVNENYLEGDIIIANSFDKFNYIYLKYNISYELEEDDNSQRVVEIINSNKRVWIIDVTYDMQKYHAKYRWGDIYNFLDMNKKNIVYIGEDKKTRVYLFDKNST